MARICFPCFLIIFLNFHLADSNETTQNQDCKDFTCGFLGTVGFPFSESSRPDCAANNSPPKLDLVGKKYMVVEKDGNFLRVVDRDLERLLGNSSCETFYKNLSLPDSPIISYDVYHYLTLFRCDLGSDKSGLAGLGSYNKCSGFEVFYKQNPYDDPINYGHSLILLAVPPCISGIRISAYRRVVTTLRGAEEASARLLVPPSSSVAYGRVGLNSYTTNVADHPPT
nr:LEAF RUST 10 DISEASE-RESISTANCE LOCUS RECEPTOR-LIKE PROTEIN KINASE-like 1.1 [Ipomoea batatas]